MYYFALQNTLIHAQHVQVITTPVIDNLLETNQEENISKVTLKIMSSRYCMGGMTVGPAVTNADGNEFQWQGSANAPTADGANYNSALPTTTFGENSVPVDGFVWGGFAGTYFNTFPGKNTNMVMATQDCGATLGIQLRSELVPLLTNELILPGSNANLVGRLG